MFNPKLFAVLLLASFCKEFALATPQCGLVNRTVTGLEKTCGYEYTALYDYDHHFNSASRAVRSLINLIGNCSAMVNVMICSLFVPRCSEDIPGPYLPCRPVCYDYATKCQDVIQPKGLEWTVAMCDILPERDDPQTTLGYRGRCFTPPNFRDSGKIYQHSCSEIVLPACKGIPGYTKTVVSEEIQRRYTRHITTTVNYKPNDTCSQPRKEIVCAENLPGCIDNSAAFLCRHKCEKFFDKCPSPFFYKKDMCIEFPAMKKGSRNATMCKQTHWPRAENWNLPVDPIGSSISASSTTPPSVSNPTKVPTVRSQGPNESKLTTNDETPTTGTGNKVPGIHARKSQKEKESNSSKLAVGLVVTFILLLLIAIGGVGFLFYRKKRKSRQFDYHKQILYSEDKADEFEIFT